MIHVSIDSLWMNACRMVRNEGAFRDSRDGLCQEVIGAQLVLAYPERTFLQNPARHLDPSYAAAEILWYLSGEKSIKMIQHYAPQYERFSEHGEAYGAYGYRLRNDLSFQVERAASLSALGERKLGSQLSAVIELLREKPNTRQAVVTMWAAGDLIHAILGDHKDLPCTLSLQFLINAHGFLDMVVTMRSNDLWLGLPYDIFAFTCIQRLVSEALNRGIGRYVHNVGSLHVYQRNFDRLKECLDNPVVDELPYHGWAVPARSLRSQQDAALQLELAARHGGEYLSLKPALDEWTLLRDLAILCAARSNVIDSREIHSPILRRAYDNHRRNGSHRKNDAVSETGGGTEEAGIPDGISAHEQASS